MKNGTIKSLLGGVIVAGFSLGAFAEMKENPYQVIVDRNPFGLKPIPIPEPPKPPEIPPPPPMEIRLTGITTLLGPARVLLEFTDPQTKKVDRPSPMSEGEFYKDNIQIVSIDTENNRVRIKNGDAETTLDFDKNGVKPGGGGGPAPVPGMAALNPGVPPVPGMPVQQPNGRSLLGGGVNPLSTASTAPNVYNPNAAAVGANGLPVRPLRTDGASIVSGYQPNQAQPQTYQPQQPTMTREQAEAAIELRRQELQRQGHPSAAILPPTQLGRALAQPPTVK